MGGMFVSLSMWVALVTGGDARSTAVVDHVDLIEINHFCDEYGRPILHQMIFYDWCEESGRYQVRDWQPLRKTYQYPSRDWMKDCYRAIWFDKGVKRIVEGDLIRESWTQYDPELTERQYRAPEDRSGLSPVGQFGALQR